MSDATSTQTTDSSPEAPRFGGQSPRTQKVGKVVSDKMDKTVVVAVDYVRRHRLYHKRITKTSKFMAHDANNECNIGDTVRIGETRPLSKTKRWEIIEVVQRGEEN